MKVRLIGILAGALLGVIFGGGTGIVGAFGGVAGVYVFALLGSLIGFFAAPDILKVFRKFLKK